MPDHDPLAANKTLVRNYCQAFYNDRNFDLARSMLAEEFVNHHPGAGVGPDSTLRSFREQVVQRHPGFTLEIRQIVAEADQVWTYGLIRLTPGPPAAISVDIWRIRCPQASSPFGRSGWYTTTAPTCKTPTTGET